MAVIEYDAKRQPYVEVENVRLTYVPASTRQPGKDWSGSDVIRVQAHKDPATSKALFPGAEIPLDPKDRTAWFLEFVGALADLIRAAP